MYTYLFSTCGSVIGEYMHPARILEPGTLTWAGARAAGTEGCEHISWAAHAPSDGRLARTKKLFPRTALFRRSVFTAK